MPFDNIRFVLAETTHPGNIGSTARAMKNMALERLYLVNPRVFPHSDATVRASNAQDVLAKATVCTSIADAVADCSLVLGSSNRNRKVPLPVYSPRQCAELVHQNVAEGQQVAVLFGRERVGLLNEELDLCHGMIQIPTNPDYSSLNLASAAQLIAYEIFCGAAAQEATDQTTDFASAQDLERLHEHLEKVLIDIEFLDPTQPKHLMRRMRRMIAKIRPDMTELNILRGILSAVAQRIP